MGRSQSPVLNPGCARGVPLQQSLHCDMQLVLLNKNLPDMGCGRIRGPLWPSPHSQGPVWSEPPAPAISLGQTSVPLGYPGKGQLCRRCIPEVGRGPCSLRVSSLTWHFSLDNFPPQPVFSPAGTA